MTYASQIAIADVISRDSCQHVFCTKRNQSTLPELDERPKANYTYTLAAVCRLCRMHMEVLVNYNMKKEPNPCPNSSYPLHHLVHCQWRETLARNEVAQSDCDVETETYAFECSSPICSAAVFVHLRPPRLPPVSVHILTNSELLKQRQDEAFKANPVLLEGMRRPTSVEVLTDLRAYIRNSWFTEKNKPIPSNNKRFIMRFGPEGYACKTVLESLRFELRVGLCVVLKCHTKTIITNPAQESHWIAPRPDTKETPPLQKPTNVFLDDVEQEICSLILQRPRNEREQVQDITQLEDSSREIARIFGSQDCSVTSPVHFPMR